MKRASVFSVIFFFALAESTAYLSAQITGFDKIKWHHEKFDHEGERATSDLIIIR